MRLFKLTCRGAVLAAVAGYGMAQTQVDLRTQSKSVDFSAASSTKPMQTGTSLPATCSIGAMFLNTSAAAGQNVYACTSANTWTLQSGGAIPSAAGNANELLTNNGSALQWQAIGGDASGSPGALTVTGIQGRSVAATAPASGQVLTWNAAAGQWAPNNPGSAVGAYSNSFTSQTTVTIPGATHQLNSANLLVTCYDTEIPAMEVEPNSVSVNASTFDVTVTFTSAQSGRCVVASGGGGAGGGINLGASNTYSAGAKQTMAASATTAGLSLTPGTLPTNPVAGDMAVDANAGNVLKTYNGAAWMAGSAGGGAYAASFTSQTSVTIPGTAHQLNTANLVVNCYDTETPAMEVDPNTVAVNLATYDVTVNFAQAQSGRCVVSSGGSAIGANGGSAGATMAAQLGDFAVVSSSSTTLTIGGNCSAATPCNVRLGNQTYAFTSSAAVTLAGGTGTAYFYVDGNGQLTVGHNLALTCTGCTAVPGITGFPPNAVPLFTWLAANGSWSGSPADYRAFLGSQNVAAGTGITVANSGSTMLVGVDTAVVPTYLTASATLSFSAIAAGSCAADQTFPLPGATPGDAVAPGWPASLPAGVIGTMWVSANGALSVRLCNLSAAAVSAASNTYTAADVRSF